MRVIGLAVLLAVSLALAPLAAEAQQLEKVWRIGWLGISSPAPPGEFTAGLSERGYIEGQNIVIERRYSEGREERFPGYAAELVQMKVDVIVVVTTQGALAAKAATSSIPIILAGVLDPERSGLIASLGRPGGGMSRASRISFWRYRPNNSNSSRKPCPDSGAWRYCGIRRTQHQPWR